MKDSTYNAWGCGIFLFAVISFGLLAWFSSHGQAVEMAACRQRGGTLIVNGVGCVAIDEDGTVRSRGGAKPFWRH